MASGCAVLAPLGPAADEAVVHGVDALVLPPFTREAWSRSVAQLVAEPERRRELGAAARAHASARTWDDEARELDAAYREAIAPRPRQRRGGCGPTSTCARAPSSPRRRSSPPAGSGASRSSRWRRPDLEAARETQALAGGVPVVLAAQEVATTDGVLVGLLLSEPVAGGMTPADTAAAVHAQGGLVLAPRTRRAPSTPALRALAGAVDVHGVAGAGAEPPGEDEVALRPAPGPARGLDQRGRPARGRGRHVSGTAGLLGRRRPAGRPRRRPPGRRAPAPGAARAGVAPPGPRAPPAEVVKRVQAGVTRTPGNIARRR